MKTISKDSADIEIDLTCEDEDQPIEGNAMASGDEKADKRAERWIRRQLERGNAWAWCCAHVRVTYRGELTADAYLGGCSYKSEADFRKGGYFDDMVDECISELNAKLAKLCAA